MKSLSYKNKPWRLLFLICITLLGCNNGSDQDETGKLFTAIEKEDFNVIQTMLSHDPPDLPLIHLPLAKQHFKKIQLLVNYGAYLELKTEEGMRSFTVEEVQELYRQLEESQQKGNL